MPDTTSFFFTDSDCEVTENVLREHLKIYKNDDRGKVGGVLGLTKFKGPVTLGWRIMELASFGSSFSFAEWMDKADWGTCTNLSFRRKVLEEIKGFDTSIPVRLGGEDPDICWRVNKAGYDIICNPHALVYHTRETWSSIFDNIGRVFRWGRAEYYLQKKHPEKIGLDIPKYPTAFFLMLIIFLGLFLSNILPRIILLFPIMWIVLTFFINALLTLLTFQKSLLLLGCQFLAEVLFFIYDTGLIIESLRNRSIQGLYKRIVVMHTKAGIIKWHKDVVRCWSVFLSTLTLLTLLVVFFK